MQKAGEDVSETARVLLGVVRQPESGRSGAVRGGRLRPATLLKRGDPFARTLLRLGNLRGGHLLRHLVA
jgi:hypothetical protein